MALGNLQCSYIFNVACCVTFFARGSNQDDVIGLILVKELLQFWQAKDAPCVSQLEIRPMPHIPADTPMFDVLRLFQVCGSWQV